MKQAQQNIYMNQVRSYKKYHKKYKILKTRFINPHLNHNIPIFIQKIYIFGKIPSS